MKRVQTLLRMSTILHLVGVLVLVAATSLPRAVSQSPTPAPPPTPIPSFVTVSFNLRIPKPDGEDFVITGDGDELANWDLKIANKLNLNITDPANPFYTIQKRLQRGEDIEFKVLVVDSQTQKCKCMMPGPNGLIEVPQGGDGNTDEVIQKDFSWDSECSDASCNTDDPCEVSDPCSYLASIARLRN